MPRRPTLKQQKAAKILVEKVRRGETPPIGQIMREAGYSETISLQPHKLTESPTFQQLLDQYMPDDILVKVGMEGLMATKRDQFSGEISADYNVRHKYWDTALKLKGKYPTDNTINNGQFVKLEINIDGNKLNEVAGGSVPVSGTVQGFEVRTESGEDVSSGHDNT